MAVTQSLPIRLIGTGAYVPTGVRTNQHFVDYLDTTEEWILTRTGIKERRQVAPDESTSTLAAHACRAALEDSGLSIDDIDIILCATATADHAFPATAAIVHGALGGKPIPAVDVNGACAGFVIGTIMAGGMLASGLYRRALVVGAEALTRFSNAQDRRTAILFGDGAGAAVLEEIGRAHV